MADCHALAKQPLASITFSPRPSECPVIRTQCHDKDPLDKICTLTSLATSAQSLVFNKSQPCSGAVIPFAQKPIPLSNLLLLCLRHTGTCHRNAHQLTVMPCCCLCTSPRMQRKFPGAVSGAQHLILTGLGFEPSGSATANSIWSCQASGTCKPKADRANVGAALCSLACLQSDVLSMPEAWVHRTS